MKPDSFDLDLFEPAMYLPLNLSASSLALLVAFQGVNFDIPPLLHIFHQLYLKSEPEGRF